MIAFVLLAGCAQPVARPSQPHTTVYQYTSGVCVPEKTDTEPLKLARKSRDDWKRYAESLEKLIATTPKNRPETSHEDD